MSDILQIKDLTKTFKSKLAVNDISFNVKSGTLFAFLGQNGAGKTTTINMLIGLLAPDSGQIIYKNDKTFLEYKDNIGVVFQNNVCDDFLTVEENLITYGSLYTKSLKNMKERFNELVELLGMQGFIKQRYRTLSGGQKRKVEIARALFASPEILFLDEPTTGLDPKTRADVWYIINKLKNEQGMTIFLTTHYMEEASRADDVVIINNGTIVASDTPLELKRKYTTDKIAIIAKDKDKLVAKLDQDKINYIYNGEEIIINVLDVSESIKILKKLEDFIKSYEVRNGSMDDVFLTVVGEYDFDRDGNNGHN